MHRLRRRPASEQGVSAIDITLAMALAAVVLGAGLVSVSGHIGLRDLRGWSDTVVGDLRAAQQLGIARRAPAVVVFTSRAGATPASYLTTVRGATVRRQTLPLSMDLSAATVQFDPLGASLAPLPVSVTLSSTQTGRTRTVTVAPGSGVVTVTEP